MRDQEEKTTVQRILDNRRELERMENKYKYNDVKLVCAIVGVGVVTLLIFRFVTTGSFL